MKRISLLALGASLFAAAPAYAGLAVPAPVLGAGLPGLALLGAVGGGYLFLKWRKRRG